MKKQIRKKAAPKIQKVDLTWIELWSCGQFLITVLIGFALIYMLETKLSNINQSIKNTNHRLRMIEIDTQDIDRSTNNINHNIYVLGNKMFPVKAGKK